MSTPVQARKLFNSLKFFKKSAGGKRRGTGDTKATPATLGATGTTPGAVHRSKSKSASAREVMQQPSGVRAARWMIECMDERPRPKGRESCPLEPTSTIPAVRPPIKSVSNSNSRASASDMDQLAARIANWRMEQGNSDE